MSKENKKRVLLNEKDFEEEVRRFGNRVDFIVAMEMGHKLDPQKAYEMIKREYKLFKSGVKRREKESEKA